MGILIDEYHCKNHQLQLLRNGYIYTYVVKDNGITIRMEQGIYDETFEAVLWFQQVAQEDIKTLERGESL